MRWASILLMASMALPAYPQARSESELPAPFPRALPPESLPEHSVAERAELYRRIAGTDSLAELAALLRTAAAAPFDSLERREIGVLFERYFELDAAGAVRIAAELRAAGPDFTGVLFGRLVRADANAALEELSRIDDPLVARQVAPAVLRGLGGGERAFELVAASLHGPAAQQFRADALMQLVATAPAKALAEALRLEDRAQRESFARTIIGSWAGTAPGDALAAIEAIQDPALATALRTTVLRGWRDMPSLVTYFTALDRETQRQMLLGGVLDSLIAAEPVLAAEVVADVPASDERRRLLWQIGASYADKDFAAALAWARGLGSEASEVIGPMVASVARRDPLRALDLASSMSEPERSQAYFAAISSGTMRPEQLPALAGRLSGLEDGQLKTSLLVSLAGTWVSQPEGVTAALDWMLATSEALPAEAFERVGYLLAQSDPAGAAAYVDRVPRDARSAWVSAVTTGYATRDPEGALAFLERFRGDPAFDRAATTLVPQLATRDPASAARLLASVSSRGADGAGPEFAIAREWVQRDPAAAAQWALDLPPLQRGLALTIVTGGWVQRDPDTVRAWVLRQSPGERRDQALAALVRGGGGAPPDAALLAAFSDDRARQAALMTTILATAQTDAAAARGLVDRYITDERLRAQAEQLIVSFERGAAPALGSPFGIVGTAPAGAIAPATGVFGPGGGRPIITAPNGLRIPVRPPEPGLVPLPAGVVPMSGPMPVPRSPVSGAPIPSQGVVRPNE